MKYNLENITKDDIEKVIKYNATFKELTSIKAVAEEIEKRTWPSKDQMWAKMILGLYFYKLGEMQGKRKDRARRSIRD